MLNRRADEHYRNRRRSHVPACTCVDCERRRKGLPPVCTLPTAPTETDWAAFTEAVSPTPKERPNHAQRTTEDKVVAFLAYEPWATLEEIMSGTSLDLRTIFRCLDKAGAVKHFDPKVLKWRYSLNSQQPSQTTAPLKPQTAATSETAESRLVREKESAARKIAAFLAAKPGATLEEILNGTSLDAKAIFLWLDNNAEVVKKFDPTLRQWRLFLDASKPSHTSTIGDTAASPAARSFHEQEVRTPQSNEASGNPIQRIFKSLWPF